MEIKNEDLEEAALKAVRRNLNVARDVVKALFGDASYSVNIDRMIQVAAMLTAEKQLAATLKATNMSLAAMDEVRQGMSDL
jgi:hypothetical protein